MDPTQQPVLEQLTGVWRLVSSTFSTSTGKVIYPLGENAEGLAIFTGSGYLSAQLMRPGRPDFAAGDQSAGTTEEVQAALQGYGSYYGQCEVDTEKGTLTTHVMGSLFPNWVGSEQLRYYELTGDRLILKTPPIPFGEDAFTGVLTWERL